MIPEHLQWADDINCAVTVCDSNGIILYMNSRARETFASHGDLIGKNLFECHSEASREKYAICLPLVRAMPTQSRKTACARSFTRHPGAATA